MPWRCRVALWPPGLLRCCCCCWASRWRCCRCWNAWSLAEATWQMGNGTMGTMGTGEASTYARFGWIFGSGMFRFGYESMPINTIFRGMNIHLPVIWGFTRVPRFWLIPISLNFLGNPIRLTAVCANQCKSQFLSAQAVQHFVSLTPRCQSHWSREKGWKAGHLIIEYNWI